MGERFSFANMRHLKLFIGLAIADGSMCPKCLYGARRTSKRWARCKRPTCQHRFRRVMDLGAEAKAQQQRRVSHESSTHEVAHND
jgi:hypothetical protein